MLLIDKLISKKFTRSLLFLIFLWRALENFFSRLTQHLQVLRCRYFSLGISRVAFIHNEDSFPLKVELTATAALSGLHALLVTLPLKIVSRAVLVSHLLIF